MQFGFIGDIYYLLPTFIPTIPKMTINSVSPTILLIKFYMKTYNNRFNFEISLEKTP